MCSWCENTCVDIALASCQYKQAPCTFHTLPPTVETESTVTTTHDDDHTTTVESNPITTTSTEKTIIKTDSVIISDTDPSKGTITLRDGTTIQVSTDDSNDKLDLSNNSFGVEKSLVFLFPQSSPAVIVSVTLLDLDVGESVIMHYSNDQWQQKRAQQSLTLVESETNVQSSTKDGYTFYEFVPGTEDTRFRLGSLTVDTQLSNTDAPTDKLRESSLQSSDSFPIAYLIAIIVGGVCCLLLIIGAIVFFVKRNQSNDYPDEYNDSTSMTAATYDDNHRSHEYGSSPINQDDSIYTPAPMQSSIYDTVPENNAYDAVPRASFNVQYEQVDEPLDAAAGGGAGVYGAAPPLKL